MKGSEIRYLGVSDGNIRLFEGQYVTPRGMAYNSYLILDEKPAVLDTVDGAVSEKWFGNLERELRGRTPEYLIIQHMEPDHSANIAAFLKKYPSAKIVASDKAFIIMRGFFGDFTAEKIPVRGGESLSLGKHTLRFIDAPMVHWPEVIVTYDERERTLFSADAFGRFGVAEDDGDWACEARRYYFGIVGKYGVQVQNLLKKLSQTEIEKICPLHGNVLEENIGYYVGLYDKWSRYEAEEEGVTIAYTSVYGNTKKAVERLAEKLRKKGATVAIHDLATFDPSEALEDAFRYKKLVLATTTYNGGVFPFMRNFIHELTERNYQNREVGFIENGSWSPVAAKLLKEKLEKGKNIRFLPTVVTLHSALNEESERQLENLANELCE